MREEGHAAAFLRLKEREAPGPRLENEPNAEKDPGWELADEDDDHEDDRHDTGPGQDHEVGAEHSRDRAAGADVRDLTFGRGSVGKRDEGLERRRGEAAEEIEGEEAKVSQRILDVVPEDPKEQHVADDVEPAAVHEHGGDGGERPVFSDRAPRWARVVDLAGLVGELGEPEIWVGQLVEDPDRGVDRDQHDRHDRERPRRDVVLDREQAGASRS